MPADTVVQALAKVMGDLPAIGRDDKAPPQMGGYAFRGIEAVTREVQPLLAKYGVVIAPRAELVDVRPAPAAKDGWQDIYLKVEWLITGPDGSTMTAQTIGIGRDHTDKGANKAQTQAFKYLLLHLLCVADGSSDGDAHSYEEARYVPPPLPAGWKDEAERDAVWQELRDASAALPDDVQAEVKAEVRKLGFTKATFTKSHADAWRFVLPAAVDVSDLGDVVPVTVYGEVGA